MIGYIVEIHSLANFSWTVNGCRMPLSWDFIGGDKSVSLTLGLSSRVVDNLREISARISPEFMKILQKRTQVSKKRQSEKVVSK